MTISDIKDQLKKLEEIGAIRVLSYPSHSQGFSHSLLDFKGEHFFKWHDLESNVLLSDYAQGNIVTALKKYTESKGHWFVFSAKPYVPYFAYYASIHHVEGNSILTKSKSYAPTDVQAALEAFLEAFGK
jgi:hypothetical protein